MKFRIGMVIKRRSLAYTRARARKGDSTSRVISNSHAYQHDEMRRIAEGGIDIGLYHGNNLEGMQLPKMN